MLTSSAARWDAYYARVSTPDQKLASQVPDLETHAAAAGRPWEWYRETFTGKVMQRPVLLSLLQHVREGKIARIVVWRLDRLGRSMMEMLALVEELQSRGVGLVSLRENFDLSTPAGRLMFALLASFAAYETELRGERVAAGQAAAKKAGVTWGGSQPGRVYRATPEKAAAVRRLHAAGEPVAAIARVVELDRKTVYKILQAQ